MGYFGNIWVKQNVLEFAGDKNNGHEHTFDHVSMLVSGRVRVEVKGKEPKEFTAPTFIVIRKELQHQITALEDHTVYYCVFAMRNFDGEVMEVYDGEHDPINELSAATVPPGYWEAKEKLKNT